LIEDRRIAAAARALAARLPRRPEAAVVLGSGLSDLDLGPVSARIPYSAIPGFPRPSVPGHAGVLTLHGAVAVLRGRAHLYEGRAVEDVVRPVRVLARLGARTLVLTNAAGAIHPAFRPGDLMVIEDHLNLTGTNPLRGTAAFVDMTGVYDPDLRRAAGRGVRRGVYAAMPGPSYETPAEVRMLRRLGADAVGMSTVPEAIAARSEGMRVLGLSCLANRAAGLAGRPLSHAEVLAVTRSMRDRVAALLRRVLDGFLKGPARGRRPLS
jgi:purine-nucleoside phosphorylase